MRPPESLQAQQYVFRRRPYLEYLFKLFEKKNLLEYTSALLTSIPADRTARTEQLATICGTIAGERLGTKVGEDLAEQLANFPLVSTAEHHSFLNSELQLSSYFLLNESFKYNDRTKKLKYIPVLSCANITLNNEDYPRGLRYHTSEKNTWNPVNLSILPSNAHNSNVFGFRPYSSDELKKISSNLKKKVGDGEIREEEKNIIHTFIESFLHVPPLTNAASLCEQITKINFGYFPWLDHKLNLEYTDYKLPIYIEQEEVVNRLIVNFHLKEKTPIFKILFSEGDTSKLVDALINDTAPFLRQGEFPTFFFWYLDKTKSVRKKLYKDGCSLFTEDRKVKIDLTPAGIEEGINGGVLIPNILLTYITLHCYYQLNCAGGFNQIHYLPIMKRLYENSGLDTEVFPTKSELYFYGFNFLSQQVVEGAKNIFGLGLDLLVHPQKFNSKKIAEKIKCSTYQDLFLDNLTIIYSILKSYETMS